MIKITALFFVSAIFYLLVAISPASANHRSRVLGDSTQTLSMPPTVEGPGLILPDSPLFFLDQLKQNVRLLLALTSEDKAKVHTDIAGERLAELRFMLAKNNKAGIRTGLEGISDNLQSAAGQLSQAKFSGRNVSDLAKKINQSIKRKQAVLDLLETQAQGEIGVRVRAANEALTVSKITVEDALPEDELENEIRDDLSRQLDKNVRKTSDLAGQLRDDLDELNKQASEAAKKALRKREEALKKAIEEKNEVLKKLEERLLSVERKRQEKLLELNKEAAAEINEIVQRAQKAALRLETVQQETAELRNATPSGI